MDWRCPWDHGCCADMVVPARRQHALPQHHFCQHVPCRPAEGIPAVPRPKLQCQGSEHHCQSASARGDASDTSAQLLTHSQTGVLAACLPASKCNRLMAISTQCKPVLLTRTSYGLEKELCLQQNVDGDTVVFDVNSLQPQKVVFNAADCCAQCKKTSGCNTWTFCNSPDGCSSDCPSNVAT